MNIAIFGLGKLGLPLAVLHAEHNKVFGVDLDVEAVQHINKGESPLHEKGVPTRLRTAVFSGNLTAHTDSSVVANCDMSMVIVPTPSLPDGAFASDYVIDAVTRIGNAWSHRQHKTGCTMNALILGSPSACICGPTYHTVVVCSTVMPGECDGPIRAALEATGLRVGEDIGLVYSPEFIALGSVIDDMQNPDIILVGESDQRAGDVFLGAAIKVAWRSNPSVHRMSLTSAEIAKIALNSYVTTKISFANALSEVCEKYPDANAHDVTGAIGKDRRIGTEYLKPGAPYGGPCFPRDNRAFALVGKRVGVNLPIAEAADEINERQIDRVARMVASTGRKEVGILGAAYKPGTRIMEESFGAKLANELYRLGYAVRVYDPAVAYAMDFPWNSGIQSSTSINSCFGNDMVTVLATPHKEVVAAFPEVFSDANRIQSVVIDCWDVIGSPWDETNVLKLGRYQEN